ncbi:MAG: 1-deoxy-D-xylulose-5-phosphate synthase [Owenweeksia sp. TMED14]|nr:MAG: 1-deoxy-D-xylulose-5-phosphate synthase [Owenweeksia sp. TMED14]|tara:strand:- start:12240 stop:13847 length:1608 start_codon:yes stop_codon:yes gene_type:complete
MQPVPSLAELRKMNIESLKKTSIDIRKFILQSTKEKAGHLASSIGVAELTLILHTALDTPNDILLWDVGHQAYIHKVITGRADVFALNRKKNGPSGFPNRRESEFDPFGVGHSSTALSALIGFARADKLKGIKRNRVAVVGDGAFTGGMLFEALNDAGANNDDVLLIINDNGFAIEENVGALHEYGQYEAFCKAIGWNFLEGNINGNNISELDIAIKKAINIKGPRVLHINTYRPNIEELGLSENQANKDNFQTHFADKLIELAHLDNRIVALTAAMATGCSLDVFRESFPNRFFDGGIAEQHVLTQAAGMAAAGMRPVVNFYSTFSQRAVDQWIHDVALQNLPVILCLDRSGIVGEDGATHHGVFDLALFSSIPNTHIWAPRNNSELRNAIVDAIKYSGPSIIRYPKGKEKKLPKALERKGEMDILQKGTGTVHWCLGPTISDALAFAKSTDSVIDLRKAKPIDFRILEVFSKNHYKWIVWEDAQVIGGVGSTLALWLAKNNRNNIQLSLRGYGDSFIGHGNSKDLIEQHRNKI